MLSALQIAAQGLAPGFTGALAAAQGFGAGVGGGAPSEKKRRFVQRVGNRLVVFNSATAALRALDSVLPDEPATEVEGAAEAPKAEDAPAEVEAVEIAQIEAQAAVFDQRPIALDFIRRAQYAEALALFEALRLQQDEEDIEALLLSVH